ncbi:MAG: hypothetical protein MJ147_05895 [Clostridia bacterium]|nr:hypothetical protein [Clostridia bacterium]
MAKHYTIYKVGKFPQMTREVFTSDNGLNSDNIKIVCFDNNGTLFAGTDKGLAMLKSDKFISIPECEEKQISALFFDKDNNMYVGLGKDLLIFKNGKVEDSITFSSPVIALAQGEDNGLWILTKTVLYKKLENETEWDIKIGVPGDGKSLIPYKNGRVYVGTADNGLYSLVGKRWHWCELKAETTELLSDCVNCLYADPIGNIWAGTDKGMCVHDDNDYWLTSKTIPSLPSANVNDIAIAKNGDKYFATSTGLVHQHNGRLSYYGYKRWLPSQNALCVAISVDGKICVGTDAGLSVFTVKMMTLEEKAFELREITEKYNVKKDGYVLARVLEHEGVVSLDEGYVDSTDNDGHRTGLYTAALCFEYACTKDEKVKAKAKRSLLAMMKLVEITGIKGFAARAIRYEDEFGYGTGNRREWHFAKDAEGNQLEWLGETSSDEMVGHFYCYANYFDLVADEEDKKLIKKVVSEILDHIIENNFRLVDKDGIPTTWANWNPDLLNNDQKWMYEKGTNSLQMLTFLKVGYHITGNEKYEKVFKYLADDKHYAMNLMQYRILDGHLCHIDDNHDFLMISLLMRYTTDPQLRAIFAMGLSYHWNDEKAERNAFYNFVYGASTGEMFDADESIDELVDYPMDQIAWPLYNSHRPDLEWNMTPVEMGMIPQLVSPLSAHERRIIDNDCNRFIADSGVVGYAEKILGESSDPTAYNVFPSTGNDKGLELRPCTNFTHPYWFARYHGIIEEAE